MADTQTLHGLDGVLAKLKALPPEIVSKRGGPVKTALRKGALVIQKEWQAQIRRIIDDPNAGGLPGESTGLLHKSIQVKRNSRPKEVGANEAYQVKIKARQRYPNASTADGPVTAAKVGRLLEVGTERRAPMPWATPGYFAKRQAALDTVVSELGKGIAAVIRKMERST